MAGWAAIEAAVPWEEVGVALKALDGVWQGVQSAGGALAQWLVTGGAMGEEGNAQEKVQGGEGVGWMGVVAAAWPIGLPVLGTLVALLLERYRLALYPSHR